MIFGFFLTKIYLPLILLASKNINAMACALVAEAMMPALVPKGVRGAMLSVESLMLSGVTAAAGSAPMMMPCLPREGA